MRKFLLLSMGITLIILISSCAKDKSLPDGYNKIFGNNEGVVADTVIIQAEGTERSFSKVVDTESSTELLFGTYGPYRSGIYFKFEDLPDTAAIHSAELILNVKERIADGADTSFWNVSHQAYANAYFADIAINEINPPHKDNDLLINTFTVYSDSLGEITINLDSVQVNRWLTKGSAIQDYGIWLESFKSNFMAIYHSRESTEYTLLPQMKLIYTITDTAGSTRDTTYYYPKEDAFVLLNTVEDLNLNPDYLYIGKGIVFRGFLKFDLGLFDTTTHINRAVLELTTDPEHSIRETDGASNCIIYRLTDEWQDDYTPEEQNGASYSATVMDSLMTFDITATFQSWVDGTYDNYGFYVRSTYEYLTINRVAIYTSKFDYDLQPKIRVYYSKPSEQEF